MKKSFIFITLLGISLSINAQSFSWGFPFGIVDETDKEITHVTGDKFYRISSHYDMGVYNQIVKIDQFSLNDLEKNRNIDVSVEQPPMGLAMLTHETMFQQENEDFTIFLSEIERKTKKNQLFWQNLNIKTGAKSELIPIGEIQGQSTSNSGNFQFAQSSNSEFYAVLKEMPYEKKLNEKVEFLLLDKNKDVVGSKAFEFPFAGQRGREHKLFVTDNGIVYLIKRNDLKKQKPFVEIYQWKPETDEITTHSLKQEDDYQINQFKVNFEEGQLYLHALFTHEKARNFGMKIDMDGRHAGVRASGILSVKFSADGELVYDLRNDFSNVISNLNIKNIHFNDNQALLVMDQPFVSRKSKSQNLNQGEFSYDYTFLNNGFSIAGIDLSNGAINWFTNINVKEPDTHNDNGDYLSVLSYVDNGQLNLLYNETRDVRTRRNNIIQKRFPIKETFDANGQSINREALLSAGIGVEEDQDFELDTNYLIPVDEDKYIIRARSRAQYKYGYMNL